MPCGCVTQGATTGIGIGIVVFALAKPLTEISIALEIWTSNLGMAAIGTALGFS